MGVRVEEYYENKKWLPEIIKQISGLKVHPTTTKSEYVVKNMIRNWFGAEQVQYATDYQQQSQNNTRKKTSKDKRPLRGGLCRVSRNLKLPTQVERTCRSEQESASHLKKDSKTIDTLKCDIDNLQAAQNIKNTYSAVKAASQIANESFEVKSKECKEQIRLYQTDIKEKNA